MRPGDRRASLIAATLPLLLEHGRALTTKQIAEAAGVAEGTIFRVFATKEELVGETIDCAVDPGSYIASLEALEPTGDLRTKLVRLATAMQTRFVGVFALMAALGMMGPPESLKGDRQWRARVAAIQDTYLAEHAEEVRVPITELVRYLRLLAFVGSNTHITQGRLLTPDEMVDLVLDGTRKR